jgi:hypothetical protein
MIQYVGFDLWSDAIARCRPLEMMGLKDLKFNVAYNVLDLNSVIILLTQIDFDFRVSVFIVAGTCLALHLFLWDELIFISI